MLADVIVFIVILTFTVFGWWVLDHLD